MTAKRLTGKYSFKQAVYQAGFQTGRAYRKAGPKVEEGRRRVSAAAERGRKRAVRNVERGVEKAASDTIGGTVELLAYALLHLLVVVSALGLVGLTIFFNLTGRALEIANQGNLGLVMGVARLLGVNVPGNLLGGMGGVNEGADFGDKGPQVREGDVFYRHDGGTVTVNSGHYKLEGPRNTGIPGASTNHQGADLPLELGYPLRTWTQTTVDCTSSSGYGENGLATLKTQHGTYRAGHVNTCYPGTYGPGEVYASVGTKGVSSGPHLHWEELNALGQLIPPHRNPLQATLTGKWPGATNATFTGDIDLEFIKDKEGYQECAYADGTQWSWGHGTKAPGAGYCLTNGKEQAHQEMVAYIETHCLPLFEGRGMNANQLTAAVSFCYNTGPGMVEWDIYQQMYPDQTPNFTGYTRASTGVSLRPRREKELAKWQGQL